MMRPLIVLTLLYCCTLVILEYSGFFAKLPHNNIAHYVSSDPVTLQGKVTTPPEETNGKLNFTLRATSVNDEDAGGDLLVFCYSKDVEINQGDLLLIRGTLTKPGIQRNPGGFDYATYLSRQGIHALMYTNYISNIGHVAVPFYQSLALRARTNIIETIRSYIAPDEANILIPMLVGDKKDLSKEDKQAFTDAGVMHTLVVSGFNVAYVAGIFLLLFRVAGFKRRIASLLTMPFLLLYLFVTGNSPPALRATVMAFSIILSLSLSRESLIYHALALAAAVILMVNPQALFTASFQLSFAATIGIVYLYPFLMKPFEKLPGWIRNTLCATVAVSMAAQLAVMPILACYFNRVSLAGLISNIPIVPLTGIITAAGILLYLVHFVSSPLTAGIAFFTSFLIKIVLMLVHYFAGLPYATAHVATPALFAITLYYFFLWGIVQIQRIRYMPLILGAGGALIFSGIVAQHHMTNKQLEITSLYAANGTAVHIAFPNGQNWLLDCGREKDGQRTICPYLWSKGIRKLDKIIITSDDKRHAGGLKAVTDNFPVSRTIEPSTVISQQQYILGESTVTVLSPESDTLTVYIDYTGKRIVFAQEDTMTGKTADILHVSCHKRKNDIQSIIDTAKSEIVVLSGTVPKELPDTKNIYPLNKYGAVSVSVGSTGIRVKGFTENQPQKDIEGEQH